jgi:hypothetical protein
MKMLSSIALMLIVLITAGAARAACPTAPASYKGYDSASFHPADGRTVSDEGLHLISPKNSFAAWTSEATVIDAWICATFWFPDAAPSANIAAGIVFWKKDEQNFYIAIARRNGSFGIFKHSNAGWTTINPGMMRSYYVNSPQGPIVHTGSTTHTPESYNQIEVVTMGDYARVYINGREVMDMGSMVGASEATAGIYAEADTDKDCPWLFESVSIINLCHGSIKGYC